MADPATTLDELPWTALGLLRFEMGSDRRLGQPGDDEGPVRMVSIGPIVVSSIPVTAGAFGRFVDATGYETVAEREGTGFIRQADGSRALRADATWRQPFGPDSAPTLASGPVLQVSWIDAWEFCAWSGARLLTEAEWERAARHGIPEMADGELEWCADFYDPDFHRSEQRVNPTGPTAGTTRVARGGAPTARSSFLPDLSSTDLTFRVVRPH